MLFLYIFILSLFEFLEYNNIYIYSNRMNRNMASRQQRRGEVLFEHKKVMTNYYTLSHKNLGDKIAENLASSFQKFCQP